MTTHRATAKLEGTVELESLGELSLKGFHRTTKVFNVMMLHDGEWSLSERVRDARAR